MMRTTDQAPAGHDRGAGGDGTAIEVSGLTKSFGGRHGRRKVLDEVTFTVESGSVVTLLGHNGAGKTTTVRILTTLLSFDSGRATVFGADLRREPDRVRQAIAVTGQFAAVDENLTGRENLIFFGRLRGLDRRRAARRAEELLTQFDLAEAARQKVVSYSGGMRRRLDIAVSLCVVPRLLFLDEPTTGLDPVSRSELWGHIRQLRDNGLTVLLTTQYLDEAEALSDRIIVLKDHRVAAADTPERLRRQFGGAVCTVAFETRDEAERFRRAAGIAGDAADPGVNGGGHTVSFSGGAVDATLRRAMSALAHTGDVPLSFQVAPPTLDDVFVHLMDEQTRPDGKNRPDGEGQDR